MASQPTGYSLAQILLHWATVLAVITAFTTHEDMKIIALETWRAGGEAFPTTHTLAGFATILFVLIRLGLRGWRGAPEPEGSGLAQAAAIWGHRLLYALLLAAPVLGALTWIGDLRGLAGIHGLVGQALLLTAFGHAVMAIYHQAIKNDGTLQRMFRPDQS